MIVSDKISGYLRSLIPDNSEILELIEEEALKGEVPIIRKDMQDLLRFIIESRRPENILEIGTAVGFSGSFMLSYGNKDSHLTTIENYEPRFEAARANFKRAGVSDRVTFITGDAEQVLKELGGTYDLIFMDGPKGQYINYLEDVLRLLKGGGLLVSDNVLDNGDIADSRFAVRRRDRTIHKRMREYLFTLTHDPRLVTTILPVGDGAALSHLKQPSP
ncbi:MAG: O-methyltransferase [Eubacterium sp.]|nr:O-methyltransferase [Eubacterium sp.]